MIKKTLPPENKVPIVTRTSEITIDSNHKF